MLGQVARTWQSVRHVLYVINYERALCFVFINSGCKDGRVQLSVCSQ